MVRGFDSLDIKQYLRSLYVSLGITMKFLIKLLIVLVILLVGISVAEAAWVRNADGYYISNVCRYGAYWQTVPWYYIGSECYMPGWGLWGVRVAE